MTSRCKFGIGNRGLARLEMGTVSGAIRWPKLPDSQARRPQRERTRISTVRTNQEGRAGRSTAKAITAPSAKPAGKCPLNSGSLCKWLPSGTNGCTCRGSVQDCGAASSVSWWRYAGKAMWGNFGDRMVSSFVAPPFCGAALVAPPISVHSERVGDAPCGVGGVHSIREREDSTTSHERRNPACVRGCPGLMDESIPARVGGAASP
jgi:hypothetical protein